MTFNLGSLCMAILWNSIFIGIVFWMGKKKIYTTRKGIHLTLMFYLLGVVRMIFPIDFRPSIGIQVSKGIFPIINNVIGLEKHNLWGRQFTIAYALAAIWLIIAGVFMLRYFVKYQEMRRIFQKYSTEANEQYQSVLSRITQEKNSGISESGDYYSLCGRCIPVEYLSSGLRLFGRRIILCFAP